MRGNDIKCGKTSRHRLVTSMGFYCSLLLIFKQLMRLGRSLVICYSIQNMLSFIAAVLFFTTISSQSYTGGAVTSDNMKYIESSLANISARVADLHGPDTAITHSLTSVTSLLQLSLLKGLLADTTSKNDMSDFDGQEAKVAFNRLETLMNTTVSNQQLLQDQISSNQQTITELQELVSAMFSTLNSVQKNVKKILQQTSPNTTSDDAISSSLPRSCQEIKATSPYPVSSGYYTIADSDGLTRHVYCHMGELCGSDKGWTRIAYLDMSNGEEKCPDGLKLYEVNGVRACGRPSSGCASVRFPFEGISYSEVCGKVIGYQYASTDGAYSSKDINDAYLDGISLTHGNPRSHIWSFISGLHESGSARSLCPCGSVDPRSAPSFVGNHYFCEAAAVQTWMYKLYTDDPLWDGKGCGSNERECCTPPGLPWFHRSFSYTTSDYIEMRLCCDQEVADEDVTVSLFEIYVKE